MKTLLPFLFVIFFVVNCTPQFQKDIYDNQYFEKTTYKNRNAPYIGEWTAGKEPSLTAIKINKAGKIKICSSNQHFGYSNGKVFKEKGKIKMIFESGSQYEISSIQQDFISVRSYGQEYKYYAGKVPENCKDIFADF